MNVLPLAPIVLPRILAGSISAPHVPDRILVVEDDASIQNLIGLVLRRAGYATEEAEDGEVGLQALGADRFDLLITDNDMPGLSGINLIRKLREIPLNLPIILISGKIPWETKDLTTYLSPGVALEKPFTMAKLLGHVRALLLPIVSGDQMPAI